MPVSLKPPILAVSIRPGRYSYKLIRESGEFAVNIPSMEMVRQVLYCGRRSGRDVDKFKEVKLLKRPARKVSAPLIDGCTSYLECRVWKDLEAGDHNLILAKVLEAYTTREDTLDRNGCYNVEKVKPVLHLGGDIFVTTREERVRPHL